MQQIIQINKPSTISSRDISELTGKEHKNVCRDIRNMLDVLGKDRLSFEHIFKDAYGRDQQEFRLDRELTLTLVSGYDIPLRHRVVTRLAELESRPSLNPASLSRMQLIELAMQAEQERLQLEHKVEELEPKAEALDLIAGADGAMNRTSAAKHLQQHPHKFADWLRRNGWTYRRAGSSVDLGYQDKCNAGLLTHKVTTLHLEDGDKVCQQVLVTARGLTKLAQIFGVQVQQELSGV